MAPRTLFDAGYFDSDYPISGNGQHEVWLAVCAEGYANHQQLLWEGRGSGPDALHVDVALEPE
ncbi:MAG: hypothetical protein JW751_02885 [Polyangiaceae bacterium]|nr:hypothetical protein [Polyangiaceae bacterium]